MLKLRKNLLRSQISFNIWSSTLQLFSKIDKNKLFSFLSYYEIFIYNSKFILDHFSSFKLNIKNTKIILETCSFLWDLGLYKTLQEKSYTSMVCILSYSRSLKQLNWTWEPSLPMHVPALAPNALNNVITKYVAGQAGSP